MKNWHLSKIPKVLYLYWGRNKKLSYLKFQTVKSFSRLNPDWKIKVYYPLVINIDEPWKTHEQKSYNFQGQDCFPKLSEINNIELIEFDFGDVGIINEIPEVFKSDLIRLYLLGEYGGIWSDFDILYLKSISESSFNTEQFKDKETLFCCHHGSHSVGFLGSSKNNKDYKTLFNKAKFSCVETMYQSLGNGLLNREYQGNLLEHQLNIGYDTVYPIKWTEIQEIFSDSELGINDATIGIHWYGGSPITSEFDNVVDEFNIKQFNNIGLIKEILRGRN